jgi:DNA-directed RNA polymerase specialized sigma24 family protein
MKRHRAREQQGRVAASAADGIDGFHAHRGQFVDDILVVDDRAQAIDAAFGLKGLAGQSGRVFALREIMELDAEEICKDLGLSQSNYWVLMHRARLRLRQCVERGWTVERS